MKHPRDIELLAPARDAQVAIEAIRHGADAVYMGASQFGARAAATNDINQIKRVCDFAHPFGARVYATVNTLVYDHELKQVERMIAQLYGAGVDALIVQDMGILRLDLPPIDLHASTQCDIRTPDKARFLEAMGFSQLVLARELTLQEIADIRAAVAVSLEAFVHGALCVCYSGRCQASQVTKGRSANRGECAQLCRLPYDLTDADGRTLMHGKHLLSLRDLNRSGQLQAMIDAGISSFKIEGRLKDMGYVKNVVAHYRQALDNIINKRPDELRRASQGNSTFSFTPNLEKSFNRSFTTYFLEQRRPANGQPMASINTPKSLGEPLGKVVSASGNCIRINTDKPIANGDGLSFFDPQGNYTGIRANRVDRGMVFTKEAVRIARGTMVFRTSDKSFDDTLARASAERHIAVDATLRSLPGRLLLTLHDERGCRVTHSIHCTALDTAHSDQQLRQRQELGKLGNTIYRLRHATVLPDLFVPASLLSQLRRETIDLLDRTWQAVRPRKYRRNEQKDASCHTTTLVSSDNVANHLARQLYIDHGVTAIEPAIEIRTTEPAKPVNVMTTRYCLRRELGACLRDPKTRLKLPPTLLLRNGDIRFQVFCDCSRCEMTLTASPFAKHTDF